MILCTYSFLAVSHMGGQGEDREGGKSRQIATSFCHCDASPFYLKHGNNKTKKPNPVLLNEITFNLNTRRACARKKHCLFSSSEEAKPLYSSENNMAAQLSV